MTITLSILTETSIMEDINSASKINSTSIENCYLIETGLIIESIDIHNDVVMAHIPGINNYDIYEFINGRDELNRFFNEKYNGLSPVTIDELVSKDDLIKYANSNRLLWLEIYE